jgi:hypothetical protein
MSRPYIYTNDAGIFIGKILGTINYPNGDADHGNGSLLVIEREYFNFSEINVDKIDIEKLDSVQCTRTFTRTSSGEYIQELLETGNESTKTFLLEKNKVYVITGTVSDDDQRIFGYTVDSVTMKNGQVVKSGVTRKPGAFII